MTTRVIPPFQAAIFTVNGRTYTGSAYYDVPDQDAYLLTTNGWTAFGWGHKGKVGPTSARPYPPADSFTDATIGEVVTWVRGPRDPNVSYPGFWSDYEGNSV